MSPARQDLQAEIFKAARRGQAVVIEVVRTSVGVARSAAPHVHVAGQRLTASLPRPEKLAGSARHLAGRLPRPEDVAGSARHLAGRLPSPDKLAGNARHLTGNLPRAAEVAANARHFGERLLAGQQKLAADARRASAALFPAADKDGTSSPGSDAAQGDAGSTGTAQTGAEDTSSGGGAA
jgi:hypothetical protein